MEKKIINTKSAPAPIGPYNQAIVVNDTIYISGQVCIDPVSGNLKNKDIQIERIRAERDAKHAECEEERARADTWQEKYVNVLISDIQERKERDRTVELLANAASNTGRSRE